MSGGKTFRVGGGQPLEVVDGTPWDRIAELEAEVADLTQQLDVARSSIDWLKRQEVQTTANMRRHNAEDQVVAQRCLGLINVRRKTLPMAALLDALGQTDESRAAVDRRVAAELVRIDERAAERAS